MDDPFEKYSLSTFEALDIEEKDKAAVNKLIQGLELELLNKMNHLPGWKGVEQVISSLNDKGHHLKKRKTDAGWLSYFQETNNATRDFWIHTNREDDMVFIDVIYFEKIEVTKKKLFAKMNDEEKKEAETLDMFYDKGLALMDDYDNYSSLPLEQRLHLSLYLLDTGVNNGGFATYISNTEGKHLDDIERFLVKLGAKDLESIVKEVNALFPAGFNSGLTDNLWEILEERSETLEELDTRFYNTDENLAKLVMVYLNY